eukprot:tig00021434_g21330.t1
MDAHGQSEQLQLPWATGGDGDVAAFFNAPSIEEDHVDEPWPTAPFNLKLKESAREYFAHCERLAGGLLTAEELRDRFFKNVVYGGNEVPASIQLQRRIDEIWTDSEPAHGQLQATATDAPSLPSQGPPSSPSLDGES